ncbi:MAG: gamma-glutamyl-gamma-aminobutyrate hydrolase family protein [Planctomycetota bacterium]
MSTNGSNPSPIVGITADIMPVNSIERAVAATGYCRAVRESGGVPVILPPEPGAAIDQLGVCDALVLIGGDDPRTEPFGQPTDPRVAPVHAARQESESAMISHLADETPDMPVLGVCLGMQLMALHAGGKLDQWMADSTPTHGDHWDRDHRVECTGSLKGGSGTVHSRHRQAVSDPGSLRVCAAAHDGVTEAVSDPARRFYLGVQWHPERTAFEPLGLDLFRRLVRSARG